jgi:lysophospholipase L1-like esterase
MTVAWRRYSARVVLAAVAVFVALGACELAARVLLPAPPDDTREPRIVYRYDPEIRYVLSPSQQGWIDDGWLTINSLGFRGHEVVTPKPPGTFRVVVIGDSVTMGWGVGDAETYSAQLEALLQARFPGRRVDVANLGVGGYDTRQEVALLQRNVARLEPDLVLVGFYSNDVPDALDDKQASAPAGTRLAVRRPANGQVLRMNQPPASPWMRALRKSRITYALGRAFNRLAGRGEWGMSRFSMELDILQGRDSPDLDRAWRRVEDELRNLRVLAAADHFSVGIVVLPCKEQVLGQYPAARYQTRIRSIAESLDFFVIDPLPSLAARKAQTDALFIPYDRNHPSAAGHRIIGEAIFQDLARREPFAANGRRAARDPT